MPPTGSALTATLKYPKGFERFAYTSPQARSGGTLVLHDLGSFEKMNPFTLKGSAPQGLVALRLRDPGGAESG